MFRTLVYVYCFALYTIMLRNNIADTMLNENEWLQLATRSRRLSSYTKRFIALFIGLFGVTSSLIAISSYSLPLAHKFGYSHNPFIYALQIIKLLPNLFIYVPRFRRKFYMSIRYMLILIYFEYIPCRLRRIICIVWESLQFQQSWLFGK